MKVVITEKLYGTEIFEGKMKHIPEVGDYIDTENGRYIVAFRYFDIVNNSVSIRVSKPE